MVQVGAQKLGAVRRVQIGADIYMEPSAVERRLEPIYMCSQECVDWSQETWKSQECQNGADINELVRKVLQWNRFMEQPGKCRWDTFYTEQSGERRLEPIYMDRVGEYKLEPIYMEQSREFRLETI